MNKHITIALDAMSGDHGAAVVVPAALTMLGQYPALSLILVGDKAVLEAHLKKARSPLIKRIRLQHASQVVTMDEPPSQALRGKKNSSMRLAINLVKEGRAHACVSAGNTGALMATSRFVLKTIPGIDRPAIISAIPAAGGYTLMLDLGANADSTPEHLFEFAVMGSALAHSVYGIKQPRVGLLNIGSEEIKGNEQVKQTAQLLGESELNYIGFVEGNDIFSDKVDLVVSDGFAGNVALKTMEGLAGMVAQFIQEEFSRSAYTRMLAGLCWPVLKALRGRLDSRKYNGASFLGLRGIVVKSHGSADAVSFANAIEIALLEVEKQVPRRISRLLENQFAQLKTS